MTIINNFYYSVSIDIYKKKGKINKKGKKQTKKETKKQTKIKTNS